MVARCLVILLLNLVCLASFRSVVAQNAGGAAAAGLTACSDDATCVAAFGTGVHCAPDGYCGDAGAACSASTYCWDTCGSDGICGGVGAPCDTNDHDDYKGYKCDASNSCTGTFTQDGTNNGVCEPSGSSGSGAAAAGLVPCSTDATCTARFETGVHCAPDGYCGDAGAACSASTYCWDACGSDGICGGTGAECDTTDNDDYIGFKCAYGYTCTGTFVTDGNPTGTCTSSGPTGSQRKRRSDISDIPPGSMLEQPLCARLKETICMENGRSVCTDLRSDFMNCGACGNDCGEVEGAAVVGCVRGQCIVDICRVGWTLRGSVCIRTGATVQLQNNRIGVRTNPLL
ncbi:hypothetical protein CALVIDRAFT_251209 [Calocera viscosa TUFC12733]|uniref:Protein CPL1-like domain-containing protein n=1 Tax=Calocera viscosa (strain TUFC12733) TaxID=1330018 RepID=A0A167JFJ4_CALVF|nr:hypothetical protein CALVIDRAFT_251209 [Calocera viscosa TUFC12733]